MQCNEFINTLPIYSVGGGPLLRLKDELRKFWIESYRLLSTSVQVSGPFCHKGIGSLKYGAAV